MYTAGSTLYSTSMLQCPGHGTNSAHVHTCVGVYFSVNMGVRAHCLSVALLATSKVISGRCVLCGLFVVLRPSNI